MKLTDLNPKIVGDALELDCPCGCGRFWVVFDTADPDEAGTNHTWTREGDSFETMTLSPSIHRVRGCPKQWHGWIRNGEVTTC